MIKQPIILPFQKSIRAFWSALLLATLSSCGQPFTPPDLDILSIQETYDQAFRVAQQWQPDAQLHSADFYISVNGYPEQPDCVYAFQSSNSNLLLLVFMDREGSDFDVISMQSPPNGNEVIGEPIPIQNLKLESHQALNIIMEDGGNLFFSRHPYTYSSSTNFLRLRLDHLDDANNKGLIIWKGQFDVLNTMLFMSIEDDSGELVMVKAYGEEEQEFWFRDMAVSKRIPAGSPVNFFNKFDLRMDNIRRENGRYIGDLTIIAPNVPYLLTGELTHDHVDQTYTYEFEDCKIVIKQIGPDWFDVEVMPIVKWYIPVPYENP